MEWEALLLGLEPAVALGIGIVALVAAPVIGAIAKPEIGESVSDTGRNFVKGGLKFGIETFEKIQSSVAEAGESWQDLVAEAKSEVKASRNSTEPPREVDILQ